MQTCTGSCVDYGSGQLAKLHEPMGKARGGTLLDAPAGRRSGISAFIRPRYGGW